MDRQHHVAIWAPAGTPGAEPAYQLSAAGAKTLSDGMRGIAVTYAHSGIHDALDIVESVGAPLTKPNVVRAMVQSSAKHPRQRPLGLVTDAWIADNGDAMCSFYSQSPAANALISEGNLGSVSLTHVAESMTPLELSICNAPARPGSKVVLANISSEAAARYKAQSQLSRSTAFHTMPDQPKTSTVVAAAAASTSEKPAPKLSLADALAQLPEAAQAALATKMQELQTQYSQKNTELIAAAAKLSEAEKRLKLTDAFMKTESDILKDQLEMLLNACPDSVRQMYSATIPKLVDGFSSGDPRATMDAAVRTVMCASRALQLRSGVEDNMPQRKRVRAAEPVTESPDTDAKEPEDSAMSTPAEEPATPAIVAAAAAPATAPAPTAVAAKPQSHLDVLNSALSMAFD